MPEITTTLRLKGTKEYKDGIQEICTELRYLGKTIDTVNESIAQLNSSLRELKELRNQVV